MLNLRDIRAPLPPPSTARNSCRTGPEAQEYTLHGPDLSVRGDMDGNTLSEPLPPVSAYTDPDVCAFCEAFLTDENKGGTVYNHLGEREIWCTTCLLDKYWADREDDLRETDWPEDYAFHGTTRFGEPEW